MGDTSPKRRKLDNGVHKATSRPSFMSPTKSSLARFNPQLLPQLKSAGARNSGMEGENIRRTFQEEDEDQEESAQELFRRKQTDVNNKPSSDPAVSPTPAERTAQNRARKSGTKLEGSEGQREETEIGAEGSSPRREENDEEETAIDPEMEARITAKLKERDQLLQELRQLSREVKEFEHELYPTDGTSDKQDVQNLIKLVNSTNTSVTSAETFQPLPISSLLSSFLPFARPSVRLPSPETVSSEKPIPSHRPVELDDPLPYLSLFTPLTFTEEIRPVRPSENQSRNAPLRELHIITIRSPLNLLTATLQMIILPSLQDTLSAPLLETESLSVISVSPWALNELLPTLRKHAEEKDITALCTAFSSYWELCLKRAECWNSCEAVFPHLLEALPSTDKENDLPTGKGKKSIKKGKGKRMFFGDDEQAEDPLITAANEQSNSPTPQKLSRKDLLRHLGRSSLTLSRSDVQLRILWKIQFDWTGEAESVVNAESKFPGAWHKLDERCSLKKVGPTFQKLLRERGVFGAISILVALVSS